MNRYGLFDFRNWVLGISSAALVAAASTWSSNANAQIHKDVTKEEVALLPEYCRHSQLFGRRFGSKEGYEYWTARLGSDFRHVHHYCLALVALRRSEKTTERNNRSHYLRSAIADCGYVVNAVQPTFTLLPEVLVARGTAYSRLGQSREANADFTTAQKLAPTRVITYVQWAGALMSQGMKADAMSVVEEGLRHIPHSPALRQLGQELSNPK